MKYCIKCGTPYPDEMTVCPRCQSSNEPAPVQAPVQEPTYAPTQAPAYTPVQEPTYAPTQTPTYAPVQEPTYVPFRDPTYAPAPIPTPVMTEAPKKKSKKPLIIISAAVVGAIILLAALVLTHVICIFHDYNPATCTVPQTCMHCGQTQGMPLGHTDGKWKVSKEATLMETGEEKLHCATCDAVLNTRTIDQKVAQVVDKSFNFKDDEFIAWVNDKSILDISDTPMEIEDMVDGNTAYSFSDPDGAYGAFIFHHNEDGNIDAVMVYSNETYIAQAVGIWVATVIDSDFYDDGAISALVRGKFYSDEGMTIGDIPFGDDQATVLAPTEYIDEIIG